MTARRNSFSCKLDLMMKISFELSDKDLRYFREVLKKVRTGRSAENEAVILREAAALLEEVQKTAGAFYGVDGS